MNTQLITIAGDVMDLIAGVLTAGSVVFVTLFIIVILNLLETDNKDSGYYTKMSQLDAVKLTRNLNKVKKEKTNV